MSKGQAWIMLFSVTITWGLFDEKMHTFLWKIEIWLSLNTHDGKIHNSTSWAKKNQIIIIYHTSPLSETKVANHTKILFTPKYPNLLHYLIIENTELYWNLPNSVNLFFGACRNSAYSLCPLSVLCSCKTNGLRVTMPDNQSKIKSEHSFYPFFLKGNHDLLNNSAEIDEKQNDSAQDVQWNEQNKSKSFF